jgi:small subunit ribosomal protein S6
MEQAYEVVVVTSAEISEADRKKILGQVEKTIETEKGKIIDKQDWGKRELAYEINKATHGLYSLITFKGNPAIPAILNEKFRLMEGLLRFLITKLVGEKKKGKRKVKVGE